MIAPLVCLRANQDLSHALLPLSNWQGTDNRKLKSEDYCCEGNQASWKREAAALALAAVSLRYAIGIAHIDGKKRN
jgi:hypothetical protein